MNRLALTTAGAMGLALLASGPAMAVAAPAATVTTTTTCGPSGLQAGLMTKVCAEITGTSVVVYGQVGLAGPPSPGGPGPQPQQLITTLDANVVGGQSIGSSPKYVNFLASTVRVDGVSGTVACGDTVHAAFGVATYPWAPRPVTLDVPVSC
ncbi:hypothetical protein [Kitasatospora sp. McL0602]|uniref:hypothetical protein n=1 Tax=Kitasatospora sp. McL0602 TaxID=3439530 RepID=UPI003F8A0456